jgi:hypothetical protein
MGLSLSDSGLLGGIPERAGTSSIGVTVKDGTTMAMRTLSLRIVSSGVLAIAPEALDDAETGQPYHHAFRSMGGNAPITWKVAVGALPPGLTLSTGGILDGTPMVAGNYRFTLEAVDTAAPGASERDDKAFELAVNAAPGLQIATDTLPDAVLGQGYDQSIHASGGNPPYRWTITMGRLPDGLASSTNPMTFDFRIAGQPTAAGVASLLVHVIDGAGATADHAFAIRVIDVPGPTSSKSGCHCRDADGGERGPAAPWIGAWMVLGVILLKRRTHIASTP